MADPFTMYLSDILTIAVNLSGLPGLSLPCGFDQQGLPIGLQLIGQPFGEALLQTATPTSKQRHGIRISPRCQRAPPVGYTGMTYEQSLA